jgi:hypothetical protein
MTAITRNDIESLYFVAEGAISAGTEADARAVLETIADTLQKWLDFVPGEPTSRQVIMALFAYDLATEDKPPSLPTRLRAMGDALKAVM